MMKLTKEQFRQQRSAVRGTANPQRMDVPLWKELVRSGERASDVVDRYGVDWEDPAGWSFDRFGTTRTRLPDGRIVCIAGEHEDYYDPDFFIYNDVVVIHPCGEIDIFGYPTDVFPPTDFHTASLFGNAIYIVGSLAYPADRVVGRTPVFRLDLESMSIHAVAAAGDVPGRIWQHRAEVAPDGKSIRIAGGKIIVRDDAGNETTHENTSVFSLDTENALWAQCGGTVPTLPRRIDDIALAGWSVLENPEKAQEHRDSIVRAVPPEHILFCGDFWPMAVQNEAPSHVVVQMLDQSGRWGICKGPSYFGRETRPLVTTFFPTLQQLIKSVTVDGVW
jgi:hypothetical protein